MAQKIEIPEVLPKTEYLKLPPRERELYGREIIRQSVVNNPHGVSVAQLSRVLPFDSRTIEKHLSILAFANEIYLVEIGPTKLYLPNAKAMHAVTEKTLDIDGRDYSVYVLKNRLGEFVYVQEKKKTEFSKEIHGGILIPLSSFKAFVQYLRNITDEVEAIGAKLN